MLHVVTDKLEPSAQFRAGLVIQARRLPTDLNWFAQPVGSVKSGKGIISIIR